MTNEEIRRELIIRVNTFLNSNSDKRGSLDGLISRLKSFKPFSEKIIEILNNILTENDIKFKNENEKNEFTKFIKPTIEELAKKVITN